MAKIERCDCKDVSPLDRSMLIEAVCILYVLLLRYC